MNETRSLKFDKILPQRATRGGVPWILNTRIFGVSRWQLGGSTRINISNGLQASVAQGTFPCKEWPEARLRLSLPQILAIGVWRAVPQRALTVGWEEIAASAAQAGATQREGRRAGRYKNARSPIGDPARQLALCRCSFSSLVLRLRRLL